MKKYIIILAIGMGIMLSACGNRSTTTKASDSSDSVKLEQPVKTDSVADTVSVK